jgi:hypothetical protein
MNAVGLRFFCVHFWKPCPAAEWLREATESDSCHDEIFARYPTPILRLGRPAAQLVFVYRWRLDKLDGQLPLPEGLQRLLLEPFTHCLDVLGVVLEQHLVLPAVFLHAPGLSTKPIAQSPRYAHSR